MIALVAGTAILKQFDTIERAALLEAQNIAISVAYTGIDDVLSKPEFLKSYLAGMDKLYKRDITIVDLTKRIVATADQHAVSQTFLRDGGDEVNQTMKDGQVRTFHQRGPKISDNLREIVVPLRKNQADSNSPIVGAVILEFTNINAELVDAAIWGITFEIITGVAAVIFGLAFGIQVAIRISKRLRKLENVVRDVSTGNYSARLRVRRHDEIGQLSLAFNRMAEALGVSHNELIEHSALLEQRVEARTRELAQSNLLLEKEMQEHKIAAERNETLAYYDSLTGLPNRSLFGKLLDHNLANGRRYNKKFGILFIDLDRFKNINDSLGHEGGDLLLQEVARRINTCMRHSDVVARLGGDEFVVLVSEMELVSNVELIARKILAAISKSFIVLEQEFSVTASIGISTFPTDGSDAQTLVKNADSAMYHAKEDGKNNYVVYS
ncbi:MAG: diguanylate cyclase domain-containing protein, partial [Janthinobacterium lividum]